MSDCIRSVKSSLYRIENYCIETIKIYKRQVSPKQREIVVKTALVAIATLCVGASLIGGLGFVVSGFSTLAAFIKITRAAGHVLNAGAGNNGEQHSAPPVIEPVSIRAAKGSSLGSSATASQTSTPTAGTPSHLEPVEPVWVAKRITDKPADLTNSSRRTQETSKLQPAANSTMSPPARPVIASTAPSGSMAASVGIYASGVFQDWVVLPNGVDKTPGGN